MGCPESMRWPRQSGRWRGDGIESHRPNLPSQTYMLIKEGDEDKVMEAGSNWGTIWSVMNSGSSHPLYDQRMVMVVDGWY